MIVVADTSPLNYLIQLGCIDSLRDIYGKLIVPRAVVTEMQHPGAPGAVRAWAAKPPAWVEVVSVSEMDGTLHPRLGEGEREAISLALVRGAHSLLIDERAGRTEAKHRTVGTLAILFEAALLGYCEFPKALATLRGLGFRFSTALEAAMLESYLQRKNG
jgi:predicted nucleic acid-binding protein